ncbi:unnamed protein product [Gordionus sp. m RMFG-2023]
MVLVNGELGTQIFYDVGKDIKGIWVYRLLIESTNPREKFKESVFLEPGSGKDNYTFINVKPKLEYKISLIQHPKDKSNFYRTHYRFITSPEYF